MMTEQTKRLKQLLKSAGVVDSRGKAPSVQVERFNKTDIREDGSKMRYVEYGRAFATVRNSDLSEDQMATMKAENQYVRFQKLSMFTIIRTA